MRWRTRRAEIAVAHVKSKTGQAEIDDYVARFHNQRGRYHRIIFVTRSPQCTCAGPSAEPVHVWTARGWAELVVQLWLGDWIVKRL